MPYCRVTLHLLNFSTGHTRGHKHTHTHTLSLSLSLQSQWPGKWNGGRGDMNLISHLKNQRVLPNQRSMSLTNTLFFSLLPMSRYSELVKHKAEQLTAAVFL
ncbi:hypothetical protein PO909_001480 [Leuciscus waleckii]